jgi:hypothetical protein
MHDASDVLRMRHWRSLRSVRASNCPAMHHNTREIVAAMPNAAPNTSASCNGPAAIAPNEAAAPIVIAQPLGLCHSIHAPPRNVAGLTVDAMPLGATVCAIFQPSHRRYPVPITFISNCSDGSAINAPARPAAAAAAMDARPVASPANNGAERRNPKWAPEAVAIVVAPPGVIVATRENSATGNRDSTFIAHTSSKEKPDCNGSAMIKKWRLFY